MTKHMRPPFGVKSKPIALLAAGLLLGIMSYAQTMAYVAFINNKKSLAFLSQKLI